jgi:hypothetical protein
MLASHRRRLRRGPSVKDINPFAARIAPENARNRVSYGKSTIRRNTLLTIEHALL